MGTLTKSPGFIYFIDTADGTAVKIGFSLNPNERLRGLQTGFPTKLFLRGFIPGTWAQEQHLHAELEEFNLIGEWFQRSETVECKISKILLECQLDPIVIPLRAKKPKPVMCKVKKIVPKLTKAEKLILKRRPDIRKLSGNVLVASCTSDPVLWDYLVELGVTGQKFLEYAQVWIRFRRNREGPVTITAAGPTMRSVLKVCKGEKRV
jgi:hypothetical protein